MTIHVCACVVRAVDLQQILDSYQTMQAALGTHKGRV